MNRLAKIIMGASLTVFTAVGPMAAQNLGFDKEQYQKALWMTTRFYGAQRSGVGPNWLLATHEPTDVPSALQGNLKNFVKGQSFVKDADGDYDLTGGWFDCGDHVKFGQTEFYSAYMLLLGYSEFPEGYDDYYSFDYKGYISSDDYTWEGKKGIPNGIPDILDEVKYATDYLKKCVRNGSTFYYQVGDGDVDHNHWVTASVMATLARSEGGEAEGSRAVSKATGNVTSMAALCGSALATMARLYAPFDPEYAQSCLDKALVAYEFVDNTAKGNSAAGGFYGSKPKYIPDLVIFNVEMYRTTGDKKYLTEAEKNCSWMNEEKDYNYNYSLCYNNTEDLAAYLIASLPESSYKDKAMKVMDFYINSMYKPSSGYILNKQKGEWGILRFPANQAFSYGLYNKLKGEMTTINPYSLASIEYIMGKNSSNLSYITGFGSKSPTYVHHRNFYGSDADKETAVKIQEKFRQLGYLVGGNLDGSYNDVPGANYTYSEGGIDYNAGLVGALGYINSIINPVNVNKFGHPTPDLGDSKSLCGMRSIGLDSKVPADGKKIFTWYLNDKKVESSAAASTLSVSTPGEYKCEIDSAGEWTTSATVSVIAALPMYDYDPNIELCNPSLASIDFDYGVIPVTYQWYKDGVAVKDSTSSSYTFTKGGEYICKISSSNCETIELPVNVTSLLPNIPDAVSDASGNVTLKIEDEGDYEWYDVMEGGTPLATGNTYTTTITKDKIFYVQDAGEMDIVVGPSEKTFSGTGVNWGDIAAKFTATKPCSITSISVYILGSPYNTGSQTLTAELVIGEKKKSYTSDAFNVSKGDQFVTVTFSTPIEIEKEGSYALTCKCPAFAIAYHESVSDYSSFAHQNDPLTFTGAGNQNKGFPALANWRVKTGSGCARAVVKAIKGNSVSSPDTKTEVCTSYPNPCKEILYIELSNNDFTDNITVEFINLLGTVVKTGNFTYQQLKAGINVSDLPKGIYVIRIQNSKNTLTQRIVKE